MAKLLTGRHNFKLASVGYQAFALKRVLSEDFYVELYLFINFYVSIFETKNKENIFKFLDHKKFLVFEFSHKNFILITIFKFKCVSKT